MKVKKFLLISFLLTLAMIALIAVGMVLKKDYDLLIMYCFGIFEFAAASWLLTFTDFILYLFSKPYIPGLLSYKVMTVILFIANTVFGIVTIFTEGGFKGSSAEMMLFYLQPAIIVVFIILYLRGKKSEEKRSDK